MLKIIHTKFIGIGERTVSLGPNQKFVNIVLQSSLTQTKLYLKSIRVFNLKEKHFSSYVI